MFSLYRCCHSQYFFFFLCHLFPLICGSLGSVTISCKWVTGARNPWVPLLLPGKDPQPLRALHTWEEPRHLLPSSGRRTGHDCGLCCNVEKTNCQKKAIQCNQDYFNCRKQISSALYSIIKQPIKA